MVAFSCESHVSLASSNNVIKRAIEAGQPEGLVVATYEQTAGYGRLGRSWVSPFGGLYFSLLLRPQVSLQAMPTLGLLVALDLQRVLKGFLPDDVSQRMQIKWPNDVVLVPEQQAWSTQFDKLCGISFERHAGGLCIGIGVNVFQPFQQQVVGGKNAPVYVAQLMGARLTDAGVPHTVGADGLTEAQKAVIDRIRDMFLERFASDYECWCRSGFDSFLQEYAANLCLRGRQVNIVNQMDQSMVSGTVEGVDNTARLLVRTSFGTVEAVSSGEVTLL